MFCGGNPSAISKNELFLRRNKNLPRKKWREFVCDKMGNFIVAFRLVNDREAESPFD
jgi:hypothetical protein